VYFACIGDSGAWRGLNIMLPSIRLVIAAIVATLVLVMVGSGLRPEHLVTPLAP